jgi:type VI secretion system protein ImpL
MIKAIRKPDSYVKGDAWVLGQQNAAAINDHTPLIGKLMGQYHADFIKEWRTYLNRASVLTYKDLKDASQKLDKLSSNQSPLLELFALASLHTTVDDDQVTKAFQPVQFLVPAGSVRSIGPQNQDYVNGLTKLQQSVDAAAKSPEVSDSAAKQINDDAAAALLAAKTLANLKFNPDPEGHVDARVHELLDEPIKHAEALLQGLGPGELNAKGKALCAQIGSLLSKYPFNPNGRQEATLADLNGIFHPPDGVLWQFYETNLKKLLPKTNGAYVPAPGAIALSPAFVAFFKQAAAFSDALYAGGSPDPRFTYTLKPVPTEGVQKASLNIDGQKLDWPGGPPVSKQFTWPGPGPHGAKGAWGADGASFSDNEGLWSVFRFFGDAEKRVPTQGGESLDWIIRSGASRKPSVLPSGNILVVRFELDMGATPHVFEKGFFSHLACVTSVAKP